MSVRGLSITLALVAMTGCMTTAPDQPRESTEVYPDLAWDDLVEYRSLASAPAQDVGDRVVQVANRDAAALPPDERLASLPQKVREDPDLAHLALSRALDKPEHYHGGVYGVVGTAKFFLAPTARVADYDRLYPVMVRVLSEKYGCFMVQKLNFGELTKVTCRDKRQVVFWKSRGADWIQFYARQFDRDGYEIQVRQRRIVRISDRRII